MDADALASIAMNTASLKEIEAQLISVMAFGGIQNTKAAEEAKAEYEKALAEA